MGFVKTVGCVTLSYIACMVQNNNINTLFAHLMIATLNMLSSEQSGQYFANDILNTFQWVAI